MSDRVLNIAYFQLSSFVGQDSGTINRDKILSYELCQVASHLAAT